MENIIKLKSRYKAEHYLKKMPKPDGSESKTYLLKTDMPNLRVGYEEGKNKFIDPLGGPIIRVGEKLEEAEAIVKSIDFVTGYGWTITFE